MTLASPTNCWTFVEELFANAIANSTTFQELTKTSGSEDAKQYLYGDRLDMPLFGDAYTLAEQAELHRHFAQVYSSDTDAYGKRKLGTDRFEPYGVSIWYLERRLAKAQQNEYRENVQAEERDWKNFCGNVIDQALAWLDEQGGPEISDIAVVTHGTNTQERWENEGKYQGCMIEVRWGYES